jgi:predicted permease
VTIGHSAIRRALGAGRGGIARFFLAESALLSVVGGALGLAVAWAAVRLLVRLGPTSLPRLHEVRLGGVTVTFTFALAVLTALAFGSIPMLRLAPIAASLHDEGRGNTVSRVRQRARHLLMAGQIATVLVLLITSGLMLRSFQKLRELDPGFDPVSALSFRIGLPPTDYPDRATMVAGHRAILERLSALPGVKVVSSSTCLPLAEQGSCFSGPLFIDGQVVADRALRPQVLFRIVAGEYFEAMGTRLMRGRGIDHHDVDSNQLVAVVNDALVTISFPNQDAIGQRVKIANAPNSVWLTIVGVVSNTPTRALAEAAPSPTLYAPMFARDLRPAPSVAAMSYVVRTTLPPLQMAAAVRNAVAQVDPRLALAQVRTLEEILDSGAAQMAFTMILWPSPPASRSSSA